MIKRCLFAFYVFLVSCFQQIVPSSTQAMGWEEGSPQKIALHAAVGAAVAAVADGDVLSVASALSAKGIIDIVNLAKQGKFKPDSSGGDTKPKTDGDTNTPNNTIDNVVDDTTNKVDKVTADGTADAVSGSKLNRQLLLDEVVDHSFYKHVLQNNEFKGLGIRTKTQFREHVNNVIENPSSIRYYKDGRSVYLQESTGTVVIRNPTGTGQSTAFQPKNWNDYIINKIPSRTDPY